MIGGLKFKEGDAEQPLLGPRMLSMRVNVLKLKNASETASVLISLIISESLKLKICRKFLTAYVNIFCSNWILFFKLVTRTKIQAFTDVIAGLNSRLHKMFRMCFRRTPTYLKVPSSLSNRSPIEDAVKERIGVSEWWKEALFH